jgi:ABC-type multidrug transport system fused ATPase/permease subunit
VGGRTMIIIAHRLSSIIDADRIIVLGGGAVVESGRHEELAEKGGAYARLYEGQVELRSAPPEMPRDWRDAWR